MKSNKTLALTLLGLLVLSLLAYNFSFKYHPKNSNFKQVQVEHDGKKYFPCIFVPKEEQPFWTSDPKDQTICFEKSKLDYTPVLVKEAGLVKLIKY